MGTLTVFRGDETIRLSFEGTPTVREVLLSGGIPLEHPCGGTGLCGQCAVRIEGALSPMTREEIRLGRRLSCRTRLWGDGRLILPAVEALSAESTEADIPPSDGEGIGAAIDIGTTTVALACYDLRTGRLLASRTAANPQGTVAADVMGRIDAALHGQGDFLRDQILRCVHHLLADTGLEPGIARRVLTGNTAMLYLLTGRSPRSLAFAPYTADHLFGETVELEGRPVFLPGCVSAFVGADITCALLESGICTRKETALLADIGTNGELALWKDGTLYVTSTAAGPAFEGAGISCGCQSIPGAIERVRLTAGGLCAETIGGQPPRGLCGSGLLDAIDCLLRIGIIDETGAIGTEEAEIVPGIRLTRKDIRNVQLAKGAIAGGIRTLLEVSGTSAAEIRRFCIAGGFGRHLNLDAAVRIGLFPAVLRTKTEVMGNAALRGAASLLTRPEGAALIEAMRGMARVVDLGGSPLFQKHYIDSMALGRLED